MTTAHGVRTTYVGGCRCDECRAANRTELRRHRAARHARLAADPTAAPHGLSSTYDHWGCRCQPCTGAHAERLRDARTGSNHKATRGRGRSKSGRSKR